MPEGTKPPALGASDVRSLSLVLPVDRACVPAQLTSVRRSHLNVARWLNAYAEAEMWLSLGAPISPLLENMCLGDIHGRIESRGVRLVRFANDSLSMCRRRFTEA